ncbi:metallophosphoesterase family protein [Pseudomonas syringae]|uniref:Phosphoesterase n=1 Tax=Pseudomonas syringae TaxID=317 RepID=A0A085UWK6_PSESX|nr:metallophosphoesterase [Pseudomonas syringae]KFE47569.1 phosphoesterase [Pseudomonas syringae]
MNSSIINWVAVAAVLASFVPLAQANGPTPLNWVFTSDPQYPWTEKSDSGEDESSATRNARSRQLIEAQYANVADYRKAHGGSAAVPVMINGDMTAYGHGSERDVVFPLISSRLEGVYDFGLGNHDYANNVNDCLLNNCAAGSVQVLIDRYWTKTEMDLAARDVDGVLTYFGSLAYSKAFGDVHVVQLNNEPSYSVDFTSGSLLTFNRLGFRINDAFEWLEKDLAAARAQGKVIIVNMHNTHDWKGDFYERDRFRALIERYRVTAVFAGHLHESLGAHLARATFGTVPVFLSGSASQQTYLTAEFSADLRSLTVSTVKGNDWRSRAVEAVIDVQR